jgi:hypothetical protein
MQPPYLLTLPHLSNTTVGFQVGSFLLLLAAVWFAILVLRVTGYTVRINFGNSLVGAVEFIDGADSLVEHGSRFLGFRFAVQTVDSLVRPRAGGLSLDVVGHALVRTLLPEGDVDGGEIRGPSWGTGLFLEDVELLGEHSNR